MSKFQPGHKKVGGRQKGTVNKAKATVRKRLKELGHDPVEALVMIAREAFSEGERSVALQANKELLSYAQPKLKSVEHSTQQGGMSIMWSTGVPESGDPQPPPEPPVSPPEQPPKDDKSAIESLVLAAVEAQRKRS